MKKNALETPDAQQEKKWRFFACRWTSYAEVTLMSSYQANVKTESIKNRAKSPTYLLSHLKTGMDIKKCNTKGVTKQGRNL